jgi:hypothetical protein
MSQYKTPRQIRDAANNSWDEPAPKPLSEQGKPPATKGVPMFPPPRDAEDLDNIVEIISSALSRIDDIQYVPQVVWVALLRLRQGARENLE